MVRLFGEDGATGAHARLSRAISASAGTEGVTINESIKPKAEGSVGVAAGGSGCLASRCFTRVAKQSAVIRDALTAEINRGRARMRWP